MSDDDMIPRAEALEMMARVRKAERRRILDIHRTLSTGRATPAADGVTFTVRHVSTEELAAAISKREDETDEPEALERAAAPYAAVIGRTGYRDR